MSTRRTIQLDDADDESITRPSVTAFIDYCFKTYQAQHSFLPTEQKMEARAEIAERAIFLLGSTKAIPASVFVLRINNEQPIALDNYTEIYKNGLPSIAHKSLVFDLSKARHTTDVETKFLNTAQVCVYFDHPDQKDGVATVSVTAETIAEALIKRAFGITSGITYHPVAIGLEQN